MRAVASVGTRLLSCAFSRAKINRGHPGLLRLEKLPGRGGLCAPASRGASVPPGMTSFADASELSTFLSSAGVDVTEFGRGNAKTIADLFEEVEKGETVVDASEDGGVLRVVEVLNLYLMDGEGRVLMEEKQVLPSGHVRERGLVLSEKLVRPPACSPPCARPLEQRVRGMSSVKAALSLHTGGRARRLRGSPGSALAPALWMRSSARPSPRHPRPPTSASALGRTKWRWRCGTRHRTRAWHPNT